jgi:hypothetical protein
VFPNTECLKETFKYREFGGNMTTEKYVTLQASLEAGGLRACG